MASRISTLLLDAPGGVRADLAAWGEQSEVDLHVCADATAAASVMHRLRDDPATAHLPILLVFSDDDATDRHTALADAADGDVALSSGLDAVVGSMRALSASDVAIPAAEYPSIDWPVLSNLAAATSRDFVATLVEQFLLDAGGQTRGLRRAAATTNVTGMKRLAHALKGSAGTMGAARLAELCRRLEETIAATEIVTASTPFVITREFCRVRAALMTAEHHLA